MPFKSEKQRRYLFANEPEIARDWTETYGSKIKKAYGGRIGYYTGGQSIPSEYSIEDARKTAMQDRLGGITEVMKQADLYRQGDVGQMYMANGGITRLGYAWGGPGGKSPGTSPSGGTHEGGYGRDDRSYQTHNRNIHAGMTGPSMTTAGTLSDPREKQDYFTQTYSGQPNILGFGGGYRNLRTPNNARSGYQSRLNPANILGMLGGFIKRSPPFTFAASGINTLRNKFGPAFNMFTSSQNLEQFRDKMKGYGRTMPTIFNNPTVGGIETLGKEVSQIVDEFGNTYRDSIYSKSISEDVFNDIFSEKEAIMQNIKDYIV